MARVEVDSFPCHCWDCPHCGFRHSSSESFLERFGGEVDCVRCGQGVIVQGRWVMEYLAPPATPTTGRPLLSAGDLQEAS